MQISNMAHAEWLKKTWAIAFLANLTVGCGDGKPEDYLRADMLKIGFIPYSTPIDQAGTGTIISGEFSKKMELVSNPQTCFPDAIPNTMAGVKTGLRYITEITLPSRSSTYRVTGNARVGLIDALGKGNSPIKVGASFDTAKAIEFSYTKPQREYIDKVTLATFYRTKMPGNNPDGSNDCKKYLDRTGFISEAIKVDQMTFKFFNSSGGAIDLTVTVPQSLIEIGVGTTWQVVNKYELVISTPKYIGFKLGRLTSQDNGLSFCSSGELAKDDTYIWSCSSMFQGKSVASNLVPSFSLGQAAKLKFNKKLEDVPVMKMKLKK